MSPTAPARRRPDAQAWAIFAVSWAGCGIITAAEALTDVISARGGLLYASSAALAALGTWVVWRGAVTHRAAPVVVLVSLLAGNSMILCGDDPVLRAATAAWNLLIPLLLSPSLRRWSLTASLVVCSACAAAQVAWLPTLAGTSAGGALVVARVAAAAGVVAIPLWYLLGLRRELDAALASAAEQARTDTLTGLLNRRGMVERLPALVLTAAARGQRVAALCLDLDHFKRVNDTLGHTTGDQVLIAAAEALRGASRAEDLVVRSGGEELVVLSAAPDEAHAVAFAERLRERVARTCAPWSVTTSVGVALADPPPAGLDRSDRRHAPVEELLNGLLEAADAALYRAKDLGRDRVELAPGRAGAPPDGWVGAQPLRPAAPAADAQA